MTSINTLPEEQGVNLITDNTDLALALAGDDYPASTSTITPLKAGDFVIGISNSASDHDWIPFKAQANQHYDLVETSFNNGNNGYPSPSLGLRNAAGAIIASGETQIASLSMKGESSFIEFIAPKTGVFYVDVGSNTHSTDPVNYRLAINSYIDDYAAAPSTTGQLDLSVSDVLHPVAAAWQGTTVSNVFVRPDADWFKTSLQGGQSYTVALVGNYSALDFENNLSLLDAAGKAVQPTQVSNDSISFVAPTTGTYYVNVSLDHPLFNVAPFNDESLSYVLFGQQNAPVGTAGNDVINGSSNADLLYGRAGDDILNGKNGNDILNGGTGNDTMNGGLGNDSYYVDSKDDIVQETSTLSTEIDTVYSTSSYTLPANVENIVIPPSIYETDLVAIGNSLNNTMTAQRASNNDRLYGHTETLRGGAGNDTLIDNNSFYLSVHLFGDAGNDRLKGNGTLNGGTGKDIYDIPSNKAPSTTIEIARGDSLPKSFDVVKNFVLSKDYGSSLNLESKHVAANVATINGKHVAGIYSHHISQGIITFDDGNVYTSPLAITTDNFDDVIKYLQANITKSGDTVAFVTDHDTYVFQDGGNTDTLVELVGVSATGIDATPLSSPSNLIHLT